MIDFKLFEKLVQRRAGAIPYHIDKGEIKMLFFVPANSDNDKFEISKGRVEIDDNAISTAIKECIEETGLPEENVENIELLSIEHIKKKEKEYDLYIYLIEVSNMKLNEPSNEPVDWAKNVRISETKKVAWLTQEEFQEQGKKYQKAIIKKAVNKIKTDHQQT